MAQDVDDLRVDLLGPALLLLLVARGLPEEHAGRRAAGLALGVAAHGLLLERGGDDG